MDSVYADIFLEDYSSKPKVIAHAAITPDGQFSIEHTITGLDFFKLKLDASNYLVLVVLPGEKIHVSANVPSMAKDPLIIGSPNSILLYESLKEINSYDIRIRKLYMKYQRLKHDSIAGDEIASVEAKMTDLNRQKSDYIQGFVETHPYSPSCLFFVNNLDIKQYLHTFRILNDTLFSMYPDNKYVKELNYAVGVERFVQIGMVAPEISLPDTSGNIIHLSSLRGNFVLIDFWASWCGPCRRENPAVVKLYNQYHESGLEVYGVSLDTQRYRWVKAIDDDQLGWVHVSDLKKWNSEAAKAFAVRSIPFTLLLDKEGKIVAKNLRGSDLQRKLQEIFGF